MLNEKTPIECYNVEGKQIYVKREDLFGTYPAPPLAKLRGARIVLQRLKAEGITKIAVKELLNWLKTTTFILENLG